MYIDSAISQLDGGDYASAAQSCRELAEYWDKKYPIMSAMIDHGALEDADMTVGSLYDLAVKKSDNLEDELITAKNQMKSIRDGQRVTFGNVF